MDEEAAQTQITSINLMLFILSLISTTLITNSLKHYGINFIHETYISLIFGILIGLTFNFTIVNNKLKESPSVTIDRPDINDNALNLHLLLLHTDDEESRTYVYDYAGVLADLVTSENVRTFKASAFFSFILPPVIYATALKIRGVIFFINKKIQR